VEIIRRGVELGVTRKKLDLLLQAAERPVEALARCDAELELLRALDDHVAAVVSANEPTVMPQDVSTAVDDSEDQTARRAINRPHESMARTIAAPPAQAEVEDTVSIC
jgi:hypothetical protein